MECWGEQRVNGAPSRSVGMCHYDVLYTHTHGYLKASLVLDSLIKNQTLMQLKRQIVLLQLQPVVLAGSDLLLALNCPPRKTKRFSFGWQRSKICDARKQAWLFEHLFLLLCEPVQQRRLVYRRHYSLAYSTIHAQCDGRLKGCHFKQRCLSPFTPEINRWSTVESAAQTVAKGASS